MEYKSYLKLLNNKNELNIIEKFKKIFKQEIDCDDLIVNLVIECIKDLYSFFNDDVKFILKEDDPYKYYVFK